MEQLSPTVFIGLGSTGKEVLSHLANIMEEHYGTYLPKEIFKFIVLETAKSGAIHSGIDFYHLKVESTENVKAELKTNKKPYFMQWLDPNGRVLDVGSIIDGAKNCRMLGRLVLWHNWNRLDGTQDGTGTAGVAQILRRAHAEVTMEVSLSQADNKLKRYYTFKGQPFDPEQIAVSDEVHFCIVGTLCGGTCSGMFIDVAYLCKQIGGLWAVGTERNSPRPVRGFFTILDSQDLQNQTEQNTRWAANCWTAILELDYYSNPGSIYQYNLPDGSNTSTQVPPLDQCYLVSLSTSAGRRATDDLKTINHKLALALFCETVREIRYQIGAITTDMDAVTDKTSQVGGESMRAFGTFGICAYWYPKFRVASAAGCRYAHEQILEKTWLGEHPDKLSQSRRDEITAEAKAFVQNVVAEGTAKLNERAPGSSRHSLFDSFRDEKTLLERDEPSFRQSLIDLFDKLRQDGLVHREIKDRIREASKIIYDRVNREIKSRLDALANRDHMTVYEIDLYIDGINKQLSDEIDIIPPDYPTPEIPNYEYKFKKSDFWIRVTGLEPRLKDWEVEDNRRQKERVLRKARESTEAFLKGITGLCLRDALLSACRRVKGDLTEEERQTGLTTILAEFDRVKRDVERASRTLSEKRREYCKLPEVTQDVKVVTEGSSISDDADVQYSKMTLGRDPLDSAEIVNKITDNRSISDFLDFNPNGPSSSPKIDTRFEKVCVEVALDRVKGFDISSKIMSNIGIASIFIGSHSLPHLELQGHLPSHIMRRKPTLLIGYGDNIELLKEKLGGQDIAFERTISSRELDHMLIFYKCEDYLHKENLTTIAAEGASFRMQFLEAQRRADEKEFLPLFTHKDDKNHYDIRRIYRRRESEDLIQLAKDLFSERDPQNVTFYVSSELFRVDKGLLFYDTNVDGIDRNYFVDAEFLRTLADYGSLYSDFKMKLENLILSVGKEGFSSRINSFGKCYLAQLQSNGLKGPDEASKEVDQARNKYLQMRRKYFPEREDL